MTLLISNLSHFLPLLHGNFAITLKVGQLHVTEKPRIFLDIWPRWGEGQISKKKFGYFTPFNSVLVENSVFIAIMESIIHINNFSIDYFSNLDLVIQ